MKNRFLVLILLSILSVSANAQLSKVADDTFSYMKASTFGKPAVAKKTEKLALKDLDEAIEKNKEEPELFGLRAKLRIKGIDGKDGVADLNNFFGASLNLTKAIKLDSKNPQWYLERAQVHCLKTKRSFSPKLTKKKSVSSVER